VVVGKGAHLKPSPAGAFRILVPVSGSAVSRRGAEVAIALARMGPAPLQVVYVSTTRDKGARRNGASMSLSREEAILKDTGALAARYDVDFATTLRVNAAPEEAILQEIKSSGADLVVMGVDRIRGDSLNFGSVAAAVLRKSKVSVLLLSTGHGENQNASSRPRSE
jgi:nucleotide-binding universal stress UspA family protein